VRLADDPDERVRRRMALRRDPVPAVGRRLLPEILRLLHDPDSGVATAAASNPRLPPAVARELLAIG
jgi:hypothetical protein